MHEDMSKGLVIFDDADDYDANDYVDADCHRSTSAAMLRLDQILTVE